MDYKEHILQTVTQALSVHLGAAQISLLSDTLVSVLSAYDITPKKELPSADFMDSAQLIRNFIACKRIEGYKDSTLECYHYTITAFLEEIKMDLRNVDTSVVRLYLGLKGRENQNSYVDNIRRNLNSFFQWLEDEDYIVKNPVKKIKAIKIDKKMEIPFSDEDIVKMRDTCKSDKETALIDFLVSTGARRNEVCNVKITDINWESCTVKIYGKGGKERIIGFSANCKVHLLNYIQGRGYSSEYLFAQDRAPHDKLSKESLHAYVKRIGQRAGVTNVHLHRFRKYFGTYMAERGVDIRYLKDMMGHSKIETTNSYYIYANLKKVQEVHRTLAA